jgi:hypothetical protein
MPTKIYSTKIYPTIVTTPLSNWQEKFDEADSLGLTELCIFPTALELSDRKILYEKLEKSKIKSIPFAHVREEDIEDWELELFIKKYNTKVFNIHPTENLAYQNKFLKFRDIIYVENLHGKLSEDVVKKFAGVCVDFSHLQDAKNFNPIVYKHNLDIVSRYPIGCAHSSAIYKRIDNYEKMDHHACHMLDKIPEIDYVIKYIKLFNPPILALELENSLIEQIKIRDHILSRITL